MLRTILLFIASTLLLFSNTATAQSKAGIKGKVIQANGESVPFVNIALYGLPDSNLIGGAASDLDGNFQLTAAPGTYYLLVTFLGFEDLILNPLSIEKGAIKDLGKLTMTEQSQMLEEFVVEGERSQMELKLDKRVFNVGKDLSNAGSNASDILQNVPSVDVDIEGNVSLRGSENVRVLIDGKPSGMASSGDALRMLPGNMIERIEVVTNPSAKYEAEGEVGIINIVLKKEKQKGFNGAFEVHTGLPNNHGGNFSVNYRRKSINLFTSYGVNFNQNPGRGYSFQDYNGPDTVYSYENTRDHIRGGLNHVARVGADIFINDKNTLTTAVLFKQSRNKNTSFIGYTDFDNAGKTIETIDRNEDENETSQDIELTLSHVKKFDQKDREWKTDLRITQNDDSELADLVQTSSVTDVLPSYQNSNNTEDERNYILQSDYVHPFGKKAKFETGVRASLREIENDYGVNIDGQTLTDFTDKLIYTENIYAGYAILSHQYKKLQYQAGLRAEFTDIKTELTVSQLENPRTYFNLFPSAHLSYEINPKNSLQLSYSRRLSRPQFRELIPFFSYTDPRNYYGGNPDLNPEYTDSYELGYLKQMNKATLFASLYYRKTDGVVERITLTDTTGLIRRFPVNLSTQHAFGAEANGNVNITKKWRASGNLNAYYATVTGTYKERIYSSETFTLTGRATTMVELKYKINLQGSVNYSAPRVTTQGKTLALYSIDLGLSRDFFKGNSTLTLSVKDLLNSRKRRSIVDTEYLYSYSEFQWRTRQAVLSFTYRLNQKKNRNGNRQSEFEGGMYDM
jgi:outer membrane receptor protein involved in Fe transport